MKKSLRELCTAIAICFCATGNLFATDNQFNTGHTMDKNLNLTKEWDKVFPQSDKVSHSKVTFRNRYGITLAADMYKPKHADGKLPAIAISGPFGAVKEQSSGLYAQELAERGFLTIAFDPSYTGESGGEPRYVASPTSIRKISVRPSISFRHVMMWMRNISVSSVSADGEAWLLMRRLSILVSKRPLPLRCTI